MATFPIDAGTEIIYPLRNSIKSNWISHRTDDNRWRAGRKNSTTINRRDAEIGFRVKRDSYETLVSFIHTNYNVPVTLTLSGTDFFLNGNTSNDVRITTYRATREKDNWYRIEIRFLLT